MVKKYGRLFLINITSIWLVSQVVAGITFKGGLSTLVTAGLVLTLVNLAIKPLINLLLLPINLVTLGTFRWLVNVLVLWLVTAIVPQFQINAFTFSGLNWQGFIIPSLALGKFWAFVLISFLISLVTGFLLWLTE